MHGLKFQSVALPNGLIENLYGPVEGRRHDAGMLKDSGLLNDLSRAGFNTRGEVLCLYGDPAYPLRPNLMRPYCQGDVPVLTPEMEAFNTAMSSVRVSVACVASVSVQFTSKERGTRVKDRWKNGASKRAGRGW